MGAQPESSSSAREWEQCSVAESAAIRCRGSATSSFRSRWSLLVLLALAAALAIGAGLWLQRTEYFWRNPIADARFQTVTDFDGVEQAAAVSRDGHFVAFLSDRDGQMDVWVTQVGSGQFHNLTHGSAPELVNPSIRTLGFSPDGSLVTFWVRKPGGSSGGDISIWAVPTLGGEPRPYLEGVAEFDWSHDGSRLAYHTPGPGDPLFVSDGNVRPEEPAHLHCACGASQSLSTVGARRGSSSTSSRVRCQTNWTSGASVRPAELLNGSRRTMGA